MTLLQSLAVETLSAASFRSVSSGWRIDDESEFKHAQVRSISPIFYFILLTMSFCLVFSRALRGGLKLFAYSSAV